MEKNRITPINRAKKQICGVFRNLGDTNFLCSSRFCLGKSDKTTLLLSRRLEMKFSESDIALCGYMQGFLGGMLYDSGPIARQFPSNIDSNLIIFNSSIEKNNSSDEPQMKLSLLLLIIRY